MCSIKNAANSPASSSFNQCVNLCVDADTLTDFYFTTGLAPAAATVGELSGRAVVAGCDDFVVVDDDGSSLA